MEKNPNIEKVVRQHVEMNNFFAGDFVIRAGNARQKPANSEEPGNNISVQPGLTAD